MSSGPQGKKENQLEKMLPKKQSQRCSRVASSVLVDIGLGARGKRS